MERIWIQDYRIFAFQIKKICIESKVSTGDTGNKQRLPWCLSTAGRTTSFQSFLQHLQQVKLLLNIKFLFSVSAVYCEQFANNKQTSKYYHLSSTTVLSNLRGKTKIEVCCLQRAEGSSLLPVTYIVTTSWELRPQGHQKSFTPALFLKTELFVLFFIIEDEVRYHNTSLRNLISEMLGFVVTIPWKKR